jgi:hypothetical protein
VHTPDSASYHATAVTTRDLLLLHTWLFQAVAYMIGPIARREELRGVTWGSADDLLLKFGLWG